MAYQIRQLKLGGVLDQAIAITKDHFGVLFQILLFLWIPYHLISGAINLSLQPTVGTQATPEELMRANQQFMNNLPIIFGLGIIGALIILPLTNAAVIHAVAQKYLGNPVTAGEAIQKGVSKIVPLVWTSILMGLAILGGLFLFIIPGILFALWFGLAQHVVVVEGVSGAKALGRSKVLVRPYLGTFLILGFLLAIIAGLVSSVAVMVPQPHVQMIVQVLLQAALTLFSTAAMVVFYFSCRCGVENFDLEHLAASVGSDQGKPPVLDTPFQNE